MTKREFYTNVINANISEDMTTQAENYIKALDKENERRKNSLTPKQKDNEEIMNAILGAMEVGTSYTAASIGELIGQSTSKASALCGKLADKGLVIKSDTKIKGKGTVKAYTLAN